jgi:tRNA(fMet)-specific endonuclease VapC
MRYLLDTCVVSELAAKRPNPKVVAWVNAAQDTDLFLSAITIGELARGVAKLPNSRQRETLQNWLAHDLMARFAGHILPIDSAVMLHWGRLVADLEQQGRTLPAMDSLIAATALHGKLHLVTRNIADFAGTPVSLVNPWE